MARITSHEKQRVRACLIETASEHFARHGLAGTRIDDVSVGAGYAKGTIYNYFASKEQLFGEVLAEGARRAVARYRQASCEGSTRDRLRALAVADVSVLREEEGFMKVVIREAMSFREQTYGLILEQLAPFVVMVEAILRDGVATGEIRTDRPTPQLAVLFVGILGLAYIQHWGSHGAWPALDDIPDFAVSSFLDGALARRSR